MDRPIVYAGAVPYDTDLLRLGRYTKEGIGRLAEIVLGRQTVVASGFACTISASDLSLTLGPGTVSAPHPLDATPIGSLSAGLEADQAMTQALFYHDDPITLTVPVTGATVTIYALCYEQDDLPDVLPFYNADQPDQTMAGPDNRGKALPTRRTGRVSFTIPTSPPSVAGAVCVALYILEVPPDAGTLAGITPVPGPAFMPCLADLATMDFAQQINQPQAVCANSRLLSIPDWARRVELRVIGAGGGGASCSAMSPEAGAFSGAGGGAGGDSWGIFPLIPSRDNVLSITIGLGGGADQRGEPSFVTYGGKVLLTAEGGSPGAFASAQNSTGGVGGGAGGGTLWNQAGSPGSDGQYGTIVFTGNGGDGPWGGGGKAGNVSGSTASKYGAGGGGAYGARLAGQSVAGGRGFQGCAIYRFLR
ncbi:glycine-rich domain-containing protein [Asaia krungthepensis]|uniref:Glycine-rich domain-containing protein n=1 Tax=Asaia krungthepensis NRIC 0535 TaxID=1307925 RepID=A0ABQ0Q2J1_9PROT|nr:hypothetical protein [Asaia krungthepensis]GBQ88260.1 hypothetical protein AA0535_1496 [Asaia krungthepensis NRIC 0535]